MARQSCSKKDGIAKDHESEEVSSNPWEFISMSEDEEDLIYRMHKLVGDRWDLIAGRIPERTAEEIEIFWIMKQNEMVYKEEKKRTPRNI